MKIAFVLPSLNLVTVPPMGLLLLADLVRKNIPGTQIKIIDNTFEDIFEETIKFKPDMVCITALSEDYSRTIRYSKFIKKCLNVPVIIGGGAYIYVANISS